jgi:prolyl 4-hydroxylase
MAAVAESYRVKLGAWLKARLLRNPNALRVDCEGLDLFVVRSVFPPELCQRLIALVDRYATPSEIMAPHPDPDFRTSYSGNIPPEHPAVEEADRRIREVVGIQRELGEPIQGQRYAVGQQFKPHWDYFLPEEPYFPETQKQGGQRTWTAMAFLNEPEAGGHTNFTEVGVSIRPRAGNLLIWNNLTPEGELNTRSMHQGTPVTAGVKYVLTKWHRERPFRHLEDIQ